MAPLLTLNTLAAYEAYVRFFPITATSIASPSLSNLRSPLAADPGGVYSSSSTFYFRTQPGSDAQTLFLQITPYLHHIVQSLMLLVLLIKAPISRRI